MDDPRRALCALLDVVDPGVDGDVCEGVMNTVQEGMQEGAREII